MNVCVFCRRADVPFSTDEHLLPESLGGDDTCILPKGLVCDECQAYFGSKVERDALNEPPFSVLRTLLGIPTKKGKQSGFKSPSGGRIRSSGQLGSIKWELPRESYERQFRSGGSIKIPHNPADPRKVCRFLLKMAVELIALEPDLDVFDSCYDAARNLARFGETGLQWWYAESSDRDATVRWITGRPEKRDTTPYIQLKLKRSPKNVEICWLTLGYADLLVPTHKDAPSQEFESVPRGIVRRV